MHFAEIYATVRTWANENYYESVIGWDIHLADMIVDNIDNEQGDIVEQVREYLENFEDCPETYGLNQPIYTVDIHSIWYENADEVDGCIEELGGLEAVADAGDSISSAIERGVWFYIDREARVAASELLAHLDDLEDMLSES